MAKARPAAGVPKLVFRDGGGVAKAEGRRTGSFKQSNVRKRSNNSTLIIRVELRVMSPGP